jgi:hypothetical protein
LLLIFCEKNLKKLQSTYKNYKHLTRICKDLEMGALVAFLPATGAVDKLQVLSSREILG